ncbi:MAG: hypothetical protein WD229_00225 [Pirellulales bacterium]
MKRKNIGAEQSSRALQQLLQIRATVVRDGEATEIDAEGVVPGDVVWLESGNRVPADLRLISAHGLEIDESLLTGESLAVGKDPAWTGDADRPVEHLRLGALVAWPLRPIRAGHRTADRGPRRLIRVPSNLPALRLLGLRFHARLRLAIPWNWLVRVAPALGRPCASAGASIRGATWYLRGARATDLVGGRPDSVG